MPSSMGPAPVDSTTTSKWHSRMTRELTPDMTARRVYCSKKVDLIATVCRAERRLSGDTGRFR